MKVRLGDVCTIVSGSTPKTNVSEYWDGEIKWITPAELSNDSFYIFDSSRHLSEEAMKKTGLKLFPTGTVILSSRAPIGKTAISGCEMCCNQGFKNLICSDRIFNEYLYFYLKSKTEFLNSLGRGATFKEISKGIVEEIEIPLPTYDEQKRIANELKKVTELIYLRKLQLIKLEELIKSQFIEMFGDLGTDEKGWGLSRLGKCCVINPRKSDDSRISNELDVSFVAMPSVSEDGEIDTSIIRPYIEVKNGFTYFAENDVLFFFFFSCMENGKGAIARYLHNKLGFGSTEFHVLRPIPDKVIPEWIFAITKFPQFRKDAEKQMTGTGGQKRVPAAFLENYPISIPPIDQQNQFAVFMRQTDKSKFEIGVSLEKLEVLKNALMQESFG